MSVVLLILKILGIALLCIIGLVIVLLLLVLYAPIRYKVKGVYNEDIDGLVKIRWLFAGVKTTAVKKGEDGLSVLAKITVFGIPIKKLQIVGGDKNADGSGHVKPDKPGKKDKKKKKKKQKKAEEIPASTGEQITAAVDDTAQTGTLGMQGITDGLNETVTRFSAEAQGTEDSGPAPVDINEEISSEESLDDKKAEKARKKAEKKAKKEPKKAEKAAKKAAKEGSGASGEAEKKNIADRIDVIYDKVVGVMDKVSEKTEKIVVKKNHISEFLERPYTQNTIRRGKKVLKKLFKNLLPRKGNVNLLLGLKSPSSTGNILGKVSMFYPLYYRWLHITPEFHEKKIEADLWCKGRIHIGAFAVPALFLYLSKDFKKTMNLAKKI